MADKSSLAKRGRFKKPVEEQRTTLHKFFASDSHQISSANIIACIIDDVIASCVSQCEPKTIKKHGGKASVKTVETWKQHFPWLEADSREKDFRMFCSVSRNANVNSVWSVVGSTNIQRNALERHSSSAEHRRAEVGLVRAESSAECCPNDDNISNSRVTSDDEKLFRTIFYAAKEELPSTKVNSLLQLQTQNGANIKYKNISWDTITEIQSCISTCIQREIVEEVLESTFYALMIDESTDLAVQKHLSVCIRYVKNGEQVTKFLANVTIDDGKAHTIVSELVQCLSSLGLDPSNLVSLATDGASTMTGHKAGVGVQLKSKHSPFVVQTHCIAHRLNLAVTDSIKKDACLEKFRDKFAALYYFMSGSSNRTTTLKKIQALFDEPDLTVKEPHGIRWLGLKRAVEAVYWSYGSVLVTLSKFAEEKHSAAHGLYKFFIEYKTVLLVSFMFDVHEVLAVLSQQLQKQDIVFSEIKPLMEGTLEMLNNLKDHDGKYLKNTKECIIMKKDETTGEDVATLSGEKLKKYSENVLQELSTVKERYISNLRKNIQKRLKKEDSDLFKDLSLLLEPSTVNVSDKKDCSEALDCVGVFYGEEKLVKIVHGCLLDENHREEEKKVCNLLNAEKLEEEWPMVRGMIEGSYCKLTTQELCKRIINLHRDALPEFSKLCKIALCIAVTSVECERSFSVQNRIKSKYRCSIKPENLNVLINIQMSKIDVASFMPARAIRLWDTKKHRRRARLCQEYKPAKKSRKHLAEPSASKC